MNTVNFKQMQATNEVIIKLNNLRRWTDFTTEQKYNELAKQAFNCIVAFILAKKAEYEGKNIRYQNFPRIAIGRAYAKAYVYYDTPEHKIEEICKISGISKKEFDKVATEIIAEKADKEFADFVSTGIGEYETQIYKAATKIATYIELLEHQKTILELGKIQEIERELKKYYQIPGVIEFSDTESSIFRVLQNLSNLRNQNRWATCCYNVECSVLGHLFDTAVFAYFMALEKTQFNEEYATKMFFMGIFHDIAEVWTKDIPSPIKDRIKGFRKATEMYELQKLEEKLYSQIPDYMSAAIKHVMLEEEENEHLKKLLKSADYLSADSECYRNLLSGSRDTYFCETIIDRSDRDNSPVCGELHNYFVDYAKRILIILWSMQKKS